MGYNSTMALDTDTLNEYRSLLSQFKQAVAAGDEEGVARLRVSVHDQYWNALTALVEDLVVEPPFPKNITFNRHQILMLSYAVMNTGVFEWEEEFISRLVEESYPSRVYDIRLLPNALNDAYRMALNLDSGLQCRSDKAKIDQQIALTVYFVRDQLDRVNGDMAQVLQPDEVENALSLNRQYDELVRPVIEMEKRIKEHGIAGKDDISRFAGMKEQLEGLRVKRDQLLNKHSAGKEILERLWRIERGYGKILELHTRQRKLERNLRRSARKLTRVDVMAALRDELKHLKMLIRMSAQVCRLVPMSVPLQQCALSTPIEVALVMDQIVDFDPEIFNNRQAKREGLPKVLIVPGIGNGMYDWARNRLVIPTMSGKSLIENLATAMVMYRLDVDQQFNDRRLITSYKNEIKANREIRSIRKLRQILVENYISWVTKEAGGYAVMEKDVRDWFEYNIGPKKNMVIMPRDLRGLNLKDVNDRLAGLGNVSKRAEDQYRLGVLHALKEDFKAAQECFERVISVAPDYANAYYSGAICLQRLKDKRYNDFFNDFIKRAPQSWWSKKAQEMVSKSG